MPTVAFLSCAIGLRRVSGEGLFDDEQTGAQQAEGE